MATGAREEAGRIMGVVTTATASPSLRDRAETVKNVVRSVESLRDLPRPFLQPFPALRFRGSCESVRSVAAVLDSSPEAGDSVRSAPGNIERSATLQVSNTVSYQHYLTFPHRTNMQDVFSFTFDLSRSHNNSPLGSPGRKYNCRTESQH